MGFKQFKGLNETHYQYHTQEVTFCKITMLYNIIYTDSQISQMLLHLSIFSNDGGHSRDVSEHCKGSHKYVTCRRSRRCRPPCARTTNQSLLEICHKATTSANQRSALSPVFSRHNHQHALIVQTQNSWRFWSHLGIGRLEIFMWNQDHLCTLCHQTWRTGKWTIEIGDFPIKISIHLGFSIETSIYGWFSHRNLHSVRGFSSQPCLMTPEVTLSVSVSTMDTSLRLCPGAAAGASPWWDVTDGRRLDKVTKYAKYVYIYICTYIYIYVNIYIYM